MKKIIASIFSILQFTVFSQQSPDTLKKQPSVDTTIVTYTLTNGRVVTQEELDKIFQEAWDKSFGKMTEEEKRLLFPSSENEVIKEN